MISNGGIQFHVKGEHLMIVTLHDRVDLLPALPGHQVIHALLGSRSVHAYELRDERLEQLAEKRRCAVSAGSAR